MMTSPSEEPAGSPQELAERRRRAGLWNKLRWGVTRGFGTHDAALDAGRRYLSHLESVAVQLRLRLRRDQETP